MNKKTIIISGLAVAALSLGTLAAADDDDYDDYDEGRFGWSHGHMDHEMSERLVERLDDRLNLSDEQEDRIEAIIDNRFKSMHENRIERIKELISSESINKAQVRALLDFEMHAEQMKDTVASVIVEVHEVLTPEQRAQASELIGEGLFHRAVVIETVVAVIGGSTNVTSQRPDSATFPPPMSS